MKPLDLCYFHATKLGLSLVECRLADPVTAENTGRHPTRFLFLQKRIAETAAVQSIDRLRNSLYRKSATIQGVRQVSLKKIA